MQTEKRIILLTGPPGAGKGTQSRIMAEKHGWYAFSIGQLLRDTVSPEIRKIMNSGALLPAEHVVQLVVDEIVTSDQPVLVDGFPRRLDQAEAFDRITAEQGLGQSKVIHLLIDKEESWRRLSSRGRADDERTAWEHRWEEYYDKTVPAIDYYQSRGNVIEIDGNGSIETVAGRIEEAVFRAT